MNEPAEEQESGSMQTVNNICGFIIEHLLSKLCSLFYFNSVCNYKFIILFLSALYIDASWLIVLTIIPIFIDLYLLIYKLIYK